MIAKILLKFGIAHFNVLCDWKRNGLDMLPAVSKSNLAKAAGAEVTLQRTQEKLHAAVARSTFLSQKC